MAQILWMAFPEETLAGQAFTPAQQEKLEDIFDLWEATSPWRQALEMIGAKPGAEEEMLSWHENRPYINATEMAAVMSSGAIVPVPDDKEGYRFESRVTLMGYWRLFCLQWRVSTFLEAHIAITDVPLDEKAALAESLALGLCLQSLMLRLDAKAREHMAAWLANPDLVPRIHRRTFKYMQYIQLRRTQLSVVWQSLFKAQSEDGQDGDLLPYFWDHPPVEAAPAVTGGVAKVVTSDAFQGLPVCAGKISGMAVVMVADTPPAEKPADSCIFIFRHARPDTTECFAMADAVLFANGGVLSHACVVAREQGVPCITGLGADFYAQMKNTTGKVWLTIDGGTGDVRLVEGSGSVLNAE
jgi:phosphohistidine swiveling domain-containing protein